MAVEVEHLLRPLRSKTAPTAHYSILRDRNDSVLRRDGAILFASKEVGAVVQHFISVLTDRAVGATDAVVAIHAGAIAIEGCALVLPGASGSGKSTLVGALVRDGLAYLSDELTAIDCDTREVRPFPKPLALKAGSWHLFEWPHDPLTSNPMTARMVSPDDLSADWAPANRVNPKVIVFPTYDATAGVSELRKIPRGRAMTDLLSTCLPFREPAQRALETVAALVQGSDCYRLRYSDLLSATQAVRSTLDV